MTGLRYACTMNLQAIYLASASPRRSALLRQIFVPHHILVSNVDESRLPAESPTDYVVRLARAKAQRIWSRLKPEEYKPVLAADTTVVLGEEILGKPEDRAEGVAMLQRLAGRTHQVYTAVALAYADGLEHALSVSEVTFRPLSAAECQAYWNSGEPQDKAGGYAVQGLAAAFITGLSGSYSGVMGLPLAETAQLLSRVGWSLNAALDEVEHDDADGEQA
jgi:nucleoside triphosphate pyrophosphatase